CHRLGDHDRRRRQTGDDVHTQPAPPVPGEPAEERFADVRSGPGPRWVHVRGVYDTTPRGAPGTVARRRARPLRARPLRAPWLTERPSPALQSPRPSRTHGAVMTEHHEAMKRKPYEKALHKLQSKLCLLQEWVKHEGLRVIVIFEGRDAAGK